MASTNAYGECLCDSRIEAGRRDQETAVVSRHKKGGPPAAPLFEREFGQLFFRAELALTTRHAPVCLEERDQILGRDTLLACETQSVHPTTGVDPGRRQDLDDRGQRVSAILDLDTEQACRLFRILLRVVDGP